MKLINLKKQKPQKGDHYILFTYNHHDWEWHCSGVYKQRGEKFHKAHESWTHWVRFSPRHPESPNMLAHKQEEER